MRFPAHGEQITREDAIDGAARVYLEAKIRIETERLIAQARAEQDMAAAS